jgi:hypothetical protein
MVEDLMAAPLRSPLHSPLRSALRSPFASKWGNEPQVRLSATSINETAADNAVVGALTVANLPTGITVSSYAITADPDNKFAIVSTDLTIDEDVDYSTDPSHSVTIEATLSDASTVSRTFTIAVLDTAAPTLSSSTPADNATGVAIDASPALVFSENIFFNYPGGGTFDIRVAGGAVVETFTPTSTTAATGSAGGSASITTTTLTINPFADLTNSTEYAIRISATCLEDDAGNAYAGIANDTTLSFTAVAAGSFTPADITTAGWWDFSDTSALWQDAARTTPVTANNDPIGSADDKSGNSRHITAAGASRPLYKTAVPHALFADDSLSDTFTMTGMTAMSLWIALDIAAAAPRFILASNYGSYIGCGDDSSGAATSSGAGTVAFYVNGTVLASNTRDGLYDALVGVGPVVLECRDVDISGFGTLAFGDFGGFAYNGKIYEMLLTTSAVSAANRSDIATYMAAQIV